MLLSNVSFKNANGGDMHIFYKLAGQRAGDSVVVPAGGISSQLNGVLLTVDILIDIHRYSADFTTYLPKGVWGEHESPYRIVCALAGDSQSHTLMIFDNTNAKVDEFRLTAA